MPAELKLSLSVVPRLQADDEQADAAGWLSRASELHFADISPVGAEAADEVPCMLQARLAQVVPAEPCTAVAFDR